MGAGHPPNTGTSGMTVAACLQLPPLNQGEILSGRTGLNREVSWVHVVDHSDPEDSLSEGELLLTSGIALSQDPSLQREIFQIMQRQNSAALVIALGRYMPDVPRQMLQASDDCGIPIIGLAWEVNFGDITRAVLAPLLYSHFQSLERSEELGRKLLDLVLHGGGISELCERIAGTLNCPVAIFSADGTLRGCSQWGQAWGGQALGGQALSPETQRQFAAAVAALDHARSCPLHVVINRRVSGLAMPLATQCRDWMILGGLKAPLPRWEQLIAGTATAAAALLLRREEAARATTPLAVSERLLNVLETGAIITSPLVRELGLLANEPCCVLIVEPRAGTLGEAGQTVGAAIARQFGVRAMAQQNNRLVYILQRRVGRTKQWAERLAAALAQSGHACRLAITRADLPLPELAQAYGEACETLRLGRVLRPRADVLYTAQVVMLARMARNLTADARLCEVSPAIVTLEEQDRSLHGSLVETLECLLDTEGNVSLAARQLGVHRHTLLYRLGRICEILGIEFDSVSRLELRLQLMARRLASA
jgi:purine catabolism regulator